MLALLMELESASAAGLQLGLELTLVLMLESALVLELELGLESALVLELGLGSESALVLELRLELELAHRARSSTLVSRFLLLKSPLQAPGRKFFPGSQAARQRKAARRVKPPF